VIALVVDISWWSPANGVVRGLMLASLTSLLIFSNLALERRSALGFVIAHNNYSPFLVVSELNWESCNSFWCLWNALLAIYVRVQKKSHFPR